MKRLVNLKFMVMAMFVAMLSMSLTACSDDDDDNGGGGNGNNSVVGTWYATQTGEKWELSFNPNGTGTAVVTYDQSGIEDFVAPFDYIIETADDGSQSIKFLWTGNKQITNFVHNVRCRLTVSSTQLIINNITFYRKK